MRRIVSGLVFGVSCLLVLVPRHAAAQADEIQVYDGGLAGRGVFNLTLHTNFTPSGITTPVFPGAVVADRSFNGVPEWALGVTDWFEAGLYLPLFSHDRTTGWGLDGFKVRLLFAVPHADDRRFFYGSNFEFSWNATRWDESRFTSEIRVIVGWHLDGFDVVLNPIVDTAYDGLGQAVLAPAVRLAYNVNRVWAIAAEEYADYGPLRHLHQWGGQAHQVYAVIDRKGAADVEFGVGKGLTSASDDLTLKLLISCDLNRRPARSGSVSRSVSSATSRQSAR